MSIERIGFAPESSVRFEDRLAIIADKAFTDTLTIGQILKGRILRHYEGDRYLASFNGAEKIVDSVVPLRTGEIIHGRVVALGEQVQLQKVKADIGVDPQLLNQDAVKSSGNPVVQTIKEVFDLYNGSLNTQDALLLKREAAKVANPMAMALSGLVLSKQNIQLSSLTLRAVYAVLTTGKNDSLFDIAHKSDSVELEITQREPLPLTAQVQDIWLSQSATLLKDLGDNLNREGFFARLEQTIEGSDGPTGQDNNADSDKNTDTDLARWILNIQNAGSVSHRVNTLPIVINDRLVELNIAVFEQHDSDSGNGLATQYRQIVFSLQTENLGPVEISAHTVGDHLKLNISTGSEQMSDVIAAYADQLRSALSNNGWQLNGIEYGVSTRGQAGVVIDSVLRHLVTPDSLSRLI